MTLRCGFRRAWTMHLAGVCALRPSAASARACGSWFHAGSASHARRHGAVEWAALAEVAVASGHILRPCAVCVPPRLCHMRMRARGTSIALGCGAHGGGKRKAHQSSRNSHRVQPGLCAGAGSVSDPHALRGLFGPIHRALACSNPARMRVPLFSGRRSLMRFFSIPMSVPCAMLVPRCQRLGIWTLAARAHERRISIACIGVPLTHSRYRGHRSTGRGGYGGKKPDPGVKKPVALVIPKPINLPSRRACSLIS